MTLSDPFNGHAPVAALASIAVAAALLYVGAGLLDARRPAGHRHGLSVVVTLLGATALWWPAQAMLLDGQAQWGRSERVALAWLFALAPAAATQVLGSWARAVSAGVFALGGLAIAPLVALMIAIGLPGAFGPGFASQFFGLLGTGALVALSLLALRLAPLAGPHTLVVRAGAALAVGLTMTLVAASSIAGSRVGLGFVVWPASFALMLLAGLSWLLRAVLLQAEPSGTTAAAPSAKWRAEAGRLASPSIRPPRPAPASDSLTQLPTRVYFEQRLAMAAAQCDTKRTRLALLFIDLDGFKPVNDSFGHSQGDLVLVQVGERLKAAASAGHVVARIGGDEFLMLVTENQAVESVSQLATDLIAQLSRAYEVDNREVLISASVGIAFYPEHGEPAKLIARADAAMYAAKRAGGACYTFYSEAMDADLHQQFELLRDLRLALAAGNQLELFYQPKIDAHSGKVTACEAVLRWKHPERGLILPGIFIPIAERYGLIGQLGNWVIDQACRQAGLWRESGLHMRVAINLSAHQLRQDDFLDRVVGALERNQVHPSLLTCEITESVAMEDTKTTQASVRGLGRAGIRLSIDDFGTGYSSLAYLRQLPAEELKIDRSFVQDVERSADARSVVDAVVKLAHALGLRVVAEGVERPQQQKILVELGCDELQGFMFAKPMTPSALLLWAMEDKTEHGSFRPSLFSESLTQADV